MTSTYKWYVAGMGYVNVVMSLREHHMLHWRHCCDGKAYHMLHRLFTVRC